MASRSAVTLPHGLHRPPGGPSWLACSIPSASLR